ncbi:MAG: hypothetical protein J6L81_09695 [Clostridia bacterium]|nr:hypothetical protein [Clostridia bacterium]
MLEPITKKYEDASTIKQFEFIFYCDCCGKAIPTTVIKFRSGFRKKFFLTNDEREARAIIYASDHGKAYERANNEVLHELNRCEKCGDMVCDDCTVFSKDIDGRVYCRKCSEKESEK